MTTRKTLHEDLTADFLELILLSSLPRLLYSVGVQLPSHLGHSFLLGQEIQSPGMSGAIQGGTGAWRPPQNDAVDPEIMNS